jgi:hypothetical protein
MHPMPELIPMLKELRLSGVLDSLEQRNRQAIEQKLTYTDFLAMVVQDEVARRAQKKLALALRRASFRNHKTIEDFDFTFNPSINRALIMDLAACRFIEEKVSVFIVGPAKATSLRLSVIAQSERATTSPSLPRAPCSRGSMPPEPPKPMTGNLINSPKWGFSLSMTSA